MLDGYQVIDSDGHVEPGEACQWVRYVRAPYGEIVERMARERFDRLGYMTTCRAGAWDPAARIADMDTEGIDVAVLFGSAMGISALASENAALFTFTVEAGDAARDPGFSAALAEGYNNWAHDYCSHKPDRLKAVALLPEDDPEAACREARRAVTELGAAGLLVHPVVNNRTLDHPQFYPIYETAQALDAPILFHGAGAGVPKERYHTHFRRHMMSFPGSIMLATMDAICGGLLERFKTLRVAFLEGGVGWLPWWMDRMDEHFEKLPSHVPFIREEPRALLRRYVREGRIFWSCEPDEEYLPFAVKEIGEEAFLYASDYPHWDSIFPDSVRAISGRVDLPDTAKQKILAGNGRRLFGAHI